MAEGKTVKEIADKYSVSRQAIYQRLREDDKRKKLYAGANGALQGIDKVKTMGRGETRYVDPETGLVVDGHGNTAKVIGFMGDERVSAFVDFHMNCYAMRQGCDKRDINDVTTRFERYLAYCKACGALPGEASARLAIGVSARDITDWMNGVRGTPEHKAFAQDFKAYMESVNEQAANGGLINPVVYIFRGKSMYQMNDQPKVEVEVHDALGDRQSAQEIAKRYADVLPDDA